MSRVEKGVQQEKEMYNEVGCFMGYNWRFIKIKLQDR